MVHSSKSGWDSGKYSGAEIVLRVPSPVWVRICKAGKYGKFEEALSLSSENFLFDLEAWCESEGMQLSKEERRLWAKVVKESPKYLAPKSVK